MGKALDILKTVRKFRKDFNGALNLDRTGWLNGHPLNIFEGRMYQADGAVIYLHLLQPRLHPRTSNHNKTRVASGQTQAKSPGPSGPVRASARRMRSRR